MKKHFLLPVLFLFSIQVNAQTPSVVIEEDYTKPDRRLYVDGDEYVKRSIENGLYIAKAGKLPASLNFGFRFSPYNNPQEKNNATEASDMEFTIIKIKGKKESFISVGINYVYLKLSYNALGQWQLSNYNGDKIYKQGTASISADTNRIMLSHRGERLRCYINGKEILQYTFENEQKWENFMRWENLQVLASDQKMVIALDKVVLKGYPAYAKYPEEIAQDLAKEAVRKAEEEKKIMSDNYLLYRFADWKIHKYGFRDGDKNVIIPAIYDEIEALGFSEGLAGVKLDKKWGFINKTGKVVIELKYDYISGFKNGYAVVVSGGKYGVINKSGKEVIAPKYSLIRNNDFVSDEAIAEGMVIVQATGGYGFADTNGIEIVQPKYDAAKKFSDGLAAVQLKGKWGFIDKAGKEVIPFKYDDVAEFSNGFCAVKIGGENGKLGFIDKTGKPVTKIEYEWVYPFREDVTLVKLTNVPYMLIDTTGKVVMKLKYNYSEGGFSEGLAVVGIATDNFDDMKCTIIDKTGKEIIPLGSWIPVHTGGFSDGMLTVQPMDSDKRGYLDKSGKLAIPYMYKKAEPFIAGKAKVELDGRIFYIDKTGQEIK